jgi:hypothetical protein
VSSLYSKLAVILMQAVIKEAIKFNKMTFQHYSAISC